ncbi:DUF6643 family protein [Streptomyces sp. NPDC052052]|uniref:DUF6643 family protein n=1 Tax=Streptomyces sp. NPDC052052 TaxID=3154756 RepID=UPI003423DD5C
MTSPRSTYGGGYYAAASFSDTPIYDSLVAERGTPQISPIRVPSAYDTGSGSGSSHLPALPAALPALPAVPSQPAPSYGYPQPAQQGYAPMQPAQFQHAPTPYIPQQPTGVRGGYQAPHAPQRPAPGTGYEAMRPASPRPAPSPSPYEDPYNRPYQGRGY